MRRSEKAWVRVEISTLATCNGRRCLAALQAQRRQLVDALGRHPNLGTRKFIVDRHKFHTTRHVLGRPGRLAVTVAVRPRIMCWFVVLMAGALLSAGTGTQPRIGILWVRGRRFGCRA